MKKIFIYTFATLIVSHFSYLQGQEFDPSLLKNLSADQIEFAKKELDKRNIDEDIKLEVKESTKEIELDDDESKDSVESQDDNSLKKYGYNFFKSIPTSISAVGDLPLPIDYKISLMDQFTVILSGSKKDKFNLNVQLDGTILFPELGSISVVGETFGEVKQKLKNLVGQSYIGVNLDLSLNSLAAKKITIVGAVKTPGTYLVNPFTTISSALAYSGGVAEIGTLRNIKLIRNNGQEFYFDLYKLLIDGDRSEDINIEAGDVILISSAKQFIELDGEVNRPAIYEIKENETFEDLIRYGAGYTNIANKKNIDFKILDIKSSSIKLLTSTDMKSLLTNVLSVQINPYNSIETSGVIVAGAIKEPGNYQLVQNETLEEFIKRLEFVDVYPWIAVLEQFDDENLERRSILFNLNDRSTYESVEMIANSNLYFFNIYQMESFTKYLLEGNEDVYEDVYEEVNKVNFSSENFNERLSDISKNLINDYTLLINHMGTPYYLPVYGKFKLESFVNFLGLDMTNVDDEVTYIKPLDDSITEDSYKNINFSASKYNAVSFRSPGNDLINVEVSGAIEYPGTYTLKSNATLEDLYQYVGNFKGEAFPDGIIFIRESIKERQLKSLQESRNLINNFLISQDQDSNSISNLGKINQLSESIDVDNLGRLSGNFSPTSKSINKTILRDGDSIKVPIIPSTISVLGEVQNQLTFEYEENINVSTAIKMAGGFNDFSNKRGVYIIKANGLTLKANSFIIGNSKLDVGDTVIVPRKLITENPLIKALQPVTQVISDLAFSAAALESLSNSNK